MKTITRQNSGIQQISINKLLPSKNIRSDYGDIEELARSIEKDGLLQPIRVYPEDDAYRIVWGHRRALAFRFLADEDKPTYSVIPAIIEQAPSDIIAVQLIENIQRKDLSPDELEKSVKSLIDSGMTQTEVAKRLNKRLTWVSDILAAEKVRENAETKGVSLEGISSTAASQIRGIEPEKLPEVVKEIKKNGGTVKAAKTAVKKIKTNRDNEEEYNLIQIKKFLKNIESKFESIKRISDFVNNEMDKFYEKN